MKIDRLDGGTILVTMEREDMREYRLDLQRQDSRDAAGALARLLYRVTEHCGMERRGKSYLVEALPSHDGCLLIISVRSVHRRTWKIKRGGRRDVCVFDNADALLDWMNAEARELSGYCVYRWERRYVLIPDRILSPQQLARLSEYGALRQGNAAAVARIREHGVTVLRRHAVRQPFKKASSAAI